MKKIVQGITLALVFLGTAHLPAAESWEGNDNFSSGANSANLWKKIADHRTKGRAFVEGGEVRYSAAGDASDAAWIWGKRGSRIPSSASWEMECTIRLPTNPPLGVNFTKAGILVGSPSVGRGSYRILNFKVYQRYDSNSGVVTNFPQPIAIGYARSGALATTNELPLTNHYPTLALVYRHNALLQRDDYEVYEVTGGTNRNLLDSTSFSSRLAADPNVVVGFNLAGKKKWSGSGLALDNWSIKAFTPTNTFDPFILTKPGTTIRGLPWTLTISNLILARNRNGTAYLPQASSTLSFGTNNLSIPVTGSIQKTGAFLLKGKGSGAAQGFGFQAVYDQIFRIENQTIVTAPR